LNSVKGVGDSSKTIVDNQPYDDFMDLAVRARPNRGLIESLATANALDCFNDLKSKSLEQIMEIWDSCVDKRNIQDRELKKAAKQKYKVISPLQQMMSGNDLDDFDSAPKIPKKTRDVTKIKIKSLDLFPEDLL
jgi:DNA polymerase III alpha subunit